jgi:hypothetical protein
MDTLPLDVWVRVLDYLQHPAVAVINRRLHGAWKQNFSAGPATGRWMRVTNGHMPVLGPPRGEAIPRTVWFDNAFPLRCAMALSGGLRRMVLGGTLPRTTDGALAAFLAGLRDVHWSQLRCLEVRIPGVNAGDTVAGLLAGVMGTAPALTRVHLNLSMNALSIRGLTSVVNGLLACPDVRDLCLNVSGNWIRGVEYGRQISRLHALPSLRELAYRAMPVDVCRCQRASRGSERRSTWGAGAFGNNSVCSTSRHSATRRASDACDSTLSAPV